MTLRKRILFYMLEAVIRVRRMLSPTRALAMPRLDGALRRVHGRIECALWRIHG